MGHNRIVNLVGGTPLGSGQLEVYTEPSGRVDSVGYRRCEVLKPTDQIELAIDGQVLGRIAISALLP